MNPEANKTLYILENLEHEMCYMIQKTMFEIIDNGDRPDKRIDAIIGLHYARRTMCKKLAQVTQSIPESI